MKITLGTVGSPDTRQKVVGMCFVRLQTLYIATQNNVKGEERQIHILSAVISTPQLQDMRHLSTGIPSKKCVVRRFRRCANVIQCTYPNLDSIAHSTPRLYDIAYCC
jgi:hypothetical protein